MALDYEKGLYVRILELDKGPHPKPLGNGFSEGVAYRVLGIYNPSESGECWLVLANDRDEIWYISQRHVRVTHLAATSTQFRMPLPAASCLPEMDAIVHRHTGQRQTRTDEAQVL